MYFGIAFWLWVCICLLIMYFFTETWWWHRQSALEERMIGLWSALVTVCFLYTDDSPLLWLPIVPRYWLTDFGVVMCMYFTSRSLAHEMEMNRLSLKNKGSFFRLMNDKLRFSSHRIKPRMPTKATKEVMKEIGLLLDKLRLGVAPDLNRVISSNVLVKAEEEILELFQNLSNAELSLIVTTINVGMLVSNVRDRPNGWGKFTHHKRRLLQFLCIDRLAAMDAAARAAILNGMQVAGLFKHYDDASRMAAYILTHTYGTDLAVVKALLDNTGNYHSLHRLMFYDVQPEEIREQVLCHILKEGQAMRKEQSHSVVSLKARKRLSGDFGNQINSLRPPLRSVASMANFKTYISDDDEEQTPTGSPERVSECGDDPPPLGNSNSLEESLKDIGVDSKNRSSGSSRTNDNITTRVPALTPARTHAESDACSSDEGSRDVLKTGILSSGSGGLTPASLGRKRGMSLETERLSSGSGGVRARVSMNQDVTVSTDEGGAGNASGTGNGVQKLQTGDTHTHTTHICSAEKMYEDFSDTKVVGTVRARAQSATERNSPRHLTFRMPSKRYPDGSVGMNGAETTTDKSVGVGGSMGVGMNVGDSCLVSASTEAALDQIRACMQMRHQNETQDKDSPIHRGKGNRDTGGMRRRRKWDRLVGGERGVIGGEDKACGSSSTQTAGRKDKGLWASIIQGSSGTDCELDSETSSDTDLETDMEGDGDENVGGEEYGTTKLPDNTIRPGERKSEDGVYKRTLSGMTHLSGDLLPLVDVLEYRSDSSAVPMATTGDTADMTFARIGKTKVLSDVDDTLVCSGGDRIAGIDFSIPRKALYPGVLLFYRLLEMGDTGSAGPESIVWPPGRVGNMVMLSARPHIYKDATERATYALFEKLVKEKDFYCIPSLLAGSIGGIKGMKAERNGVYMASFQDVYIKKLQNLNELKTLYPEENFIFVGDNGQADVKVADEALKAGVLSVAFVHLVQPIEQTFGYNAEESYNPNILFFSTYLEAAMLAFKAKLIGRAGLVEMVRVCTVETEELLANARDKHPTHWPPRLKSKFVRKMNTHILEVCDLQNLKMPLVELGDLDLLLPRSNSSTFKRASLAMVGAAAFVGRKISLGRFETQSDNEGDDEEEKETPSAPSRGIESSPLSLNITIKRRETINIGSLSPGRKRPLVTGNAMFRKALNHSSTQPAARNHGNEVKAGGDAEADTKIKIGDIATDSLVPDDGTVALNPETRLTNKPTEKPEPRNSTETVADIPIVVGPDGVQNSGSRPIQNHVNTPDTVTHANANTNANPSPHPHPNTHTYTHTHTDPRHTHSTPPEPATGTPTLMRMHTQRITPHTPGESQPQVQLHSQTQPLVLPQPQPLVQDLSLSLNEDALLTPATGLGSFSNDSIASARSCPVGDNVECARASALLGDPKFLSARPHIHRRRGERA